jgi:Flp pilus assembly protein TadD
VAQVPQQQLAEIQQLIQQNRFDDAVTACRTLLKRHRDAPELHHMLAAAQQRRGDREGADRAYRDALRVAPRSAPLLLDYGRFLRASGRAAQAERRFRKALKVDPNSVAAWQALGLLLRAGGQLAEAERCARRATELAPANPAGWELLAAVLQQRGDLAAALGACRTGLEHVPGAPRLHYSLGQLLREDCDFDAAAQAYRRAEELGYVTPDLYRNRAEALLDGGDASAALDCAQEGVQRHPEHALLQRTTARLHHEVAAPGDPLAALTAAARGAKTHADLWQTLVELLKRLERFDEARDALAEARRAGCPETPGLLMLEAMDLALDGDDAGARRGFDALLARFPGNTELQINAAMHGLSSGDPAWAAALCEAVLERDPFDQLALVYLGTAWQLLGDPREHWLLDYEQMVRPVQVPVPDGFADRESFFAALSEALEELHSTGAHPIEQSVRGGTQTNGFLFRLKHPLLQTLEQQIRRAIVSAMESFPTDEEHPFWSRRHRNPSGDGLRFAGAWSVRLRGQGYHTNHIHPEGWVSSALYISLPEEVRDPGDNAGYIQFGAPMKELGLDLPPRRVVRPEVGTLVLFPSYMWHGTVPFESTQPRITVAFDLLPER